MPKHAVQKKTLSAILAALCLSLPAEPVSAAGQGLTAEDSAGSRQTLGIGVVSPVPAAGMSNLNSKRAALKPRSTATPSIRSTKTAQYSRLPQRTRSNAAPLKKAAPALPPKPPQEAVLQLSQANIAPGVVHKCHRGVLQINILDIDLNNQSIEVKPLLAAENFGKLEDVRSQSVKSNAIAAINANYFKREGVPLGTLMIDGEWIAGPLYERISFGITDKGRVRVERANMHGIIESSNPDLACTWVNNINQPRRTGSKLIAYTRRWGSSVSMAYEGTLVAVDASGRVVGKTAQHIGIPYGGYVLSDTKNSPISKLRYGDLLSLRWHHRPESWQDVVQAVSGGPALIKNGNLYLDLKDENFKKTWTSSSIQARTALGVTADNHLILTTVEGPHTLWDLAKMLHKLGCVSAMNLDGGGSTTMVIKDKVVTRNQSCPQRKVAASLAILPRKQGSGFNTASRRFETYKPASELTMMAPEPEKLLSGAGKAQIADPLANEINTKLLGEMEKQVEKEAELASNPELLPMAPSYQDDAAASTQSMKKNKQAKSSHFGWAKVKGLLGK